MRVLYISFFLLCSTINLFAQHRTIQQAKTLAEQYAKDYNLKHTFAKEIGTSLQDDKMYVDNSVPPYYIIADTLTPAFIIVSSDKRMKDVLGVCETSTWDENNIPDGLQYLLATYKEQYELLKKGELEKNEDKFTYNITDVEPLLSTQWSQESPYNDLCPTGCPSGCVATAMAQVMRYYSYPQHGYGSFSYVSETEKHRCSYNFASATFEWDKMKDTYSAFAFNSTEGRAEVANIMYACGVSVGMDYAQNGSGALMCDVPYALIHYFGYNPNSAFCSRNYYKADEWYQTLCDELAAGRPVLYGGVDPHPYGGGHAFIIEGCKSSERKFYVNWGWGGDFNGYYELDALDPNNYRFSSNQQMITNVYPQPVGKYQDTFYAQKFTASNNIELNKQIDFILTEAACYSNLSATTVLNNAFVGIIGIGIFDENHKFLKSIDSKDVNGMNTGYYYEKITFSGRLTKSLFPKSGQYYIAPYAQGKNSDEPTRIRTFEGKTDYISIIIDGDNIDEDDNSEEEPTDKTIVWNEDFENLGIPKGWTQETFEGEGVWEVRSVIVPSDKSPKAANGKGYAFIDYNYTSFSLYDSHSIARMQTSTIPLAEDKKYMLSLYTLKYSNSNNPVDVLSVYYKKDSEWILIKDIEITNLVDWYRTTVSIPVSGNIQLAFTGSSSKGTSIFLDNIQIYEDTQNTQIATALQSTTPKDICNIYTLSGKEIYTPSTDSADNLILPKGVYIVRYSDGTSRKIYKVK